MYVFINTLVCCMEFFDCDFFFSLFLVLSCLFCSLLTCVLWGGTQGRARVVFLRVLAQRKRERERKREKENADAGTGEQDVGRVRAQSVADSARAAAAELRQTRGATRIRRVQRRRRRAGVDEVKEMREEMRRDEMREEMRDER